MGKKIFKPPYSFYLKERKKNRIKKVSFTNSQQKEGLCGLMWVSWQTVAVFRQGYEDPQGRDGDGEHSNLPGVCGDSWFGENQLPDPYLLPAHFKAALAHIPVVKLPSFTLPYPPDRR